MPATPEHSGEPNRNVRRKPVPGLLALVLLAPLRPLLRLLRRPTVPHAPAAVFASYMVGDLYMALPALKKAAADGRARVLCRPDCVSILEREGLDVLPFDNAFFARKSPATFLRTFRAAWTLRRAGARHGFASVVYDVDASPITALWMRIAGVPRVVSYRRAFGVLFDDTFPLPADAVHQADRDMAVADHIVSVHDAPHVACAHGATAPIVPPTHAHPPRPAHPCAQSRSHPHGLPGTHTAEPESSPAWLLSVWTRKPAKNWPLESWDQLLEKLQGQGVECAVLLAPDGDDHYARFRARWEGRVGFVAGSLDRIADTVRTVAGVIATDNFLGHMAGYYGKPVVWINMVSPAAQVMPRGPRTIEVAPEPGPAGAGPVTVEAVWRAWEAARQTT